MYKFNHFDHFHINSFLDIQKILAPFQCEKALIKKLPRNANDKNQMYIHSDASLLNSVFDLRFSDRGQSFSQTKRTSSPGKMIPQAVFNSFSWISKSGTAHLTKECKAIIYAQYPEARLSGFATTEEEMPRSLSIDYTKSDELLPRYIVIGANKKGDAFGIIVVNPDAEFEQQFKEHDCYYGSKVCKLIPIDLGDNTPTTKLLNILKDNVAGKTLLGCRFDKEGNTIPFTGTQVHGYTLEHACGIKPNADKDGDIFGIELKAFTRKKLTLCTPEPDGGLYAEDFSLFMKTYGYKKDNAYRLTGLHRAYKTNPKTGLTLKIYCFRQLADNKKEYERVLYEPTIPITKQMVGMEIVLEDQEGKAAASWSVERMLNSWGAKHNEVVYVPCTKHDNDDSESLENGYKYKIEFPVEVLWCKNTSAEKLFQAIHNGTVYLDPAPKLVPDNPKENKRRSQWRLNDIYKAADTLYEECSLKNIS
jgi:hypothetical protein